MSELIDAIHAHKARVRNACAHLQSTANALHRVGLTALCDEIEDAISDLNDGVSEIVKAWNGDIDKQMAHSGAMIGGIVSLVAAGRILPKTTPESSQ